MDIEEGEIIISDVSSDESHSSQPQPWTKDKFPVESFRYQSTVRTTSYPPHNRRNPQHSCIENSFCRKTFSWRNCLANTTSNNFGHYNSRDKTPRNIYSSDSPPRIQFQRSYERQKFQDDLHESQRSKKRKRKGKVERSPSRRHKPERSLRQLINHCESRSVLINKMVQLTTTTSSTSLTQENSSLMQKLITSGLAKLPGSPGSLVNSRTESCVKSEQFPAVVTDKNDDSDDSEIEVIIPPKKVPPVVTLDSDGEEMEQSKVDNIDTVPFSVTPIHEHVSENNDSLLNQNRLSNQNKTEDLKSNKECSLENSSPHRTPGSASESPESLGYESVSDVCEILPYSPSSPSTCNSSDVNLTKKIRAQSSAVVNNDTDQNSQSNENLYFKDLSGVSSVDVSTEIWLDMDKQQRAVNQDETNIVHSNEKISKQSNCESLSNEKPSFTNENSLSALVEDFIMSSSDSSKNDEGNQIVLNGKETHIKCNDAFCENKPERSSQVNVDDVNSSESTDCILPCETNITESNLQSKEKIIVQCQSEVNKGFEDEIAASITLNSNHHGLTTSEQPSHSRTVEPENLPQSKSPEINPNMLETTTTPIETENNSDSENVIMKEPEQIKGQDNTILNNKHSETYVQEDCLDNPRENDDWDDDENVSQLRMIALQTKGKQLCKETKSEKCVEKNESQQLNNLIDQNVKENTISGVKTQDTSHYDCDGDDDEDVLQLRVAALKSAVIKKYSERKKRGLPFRKRKRDTSDDIFTFAEGNESPENDHHIPSSPADTPTSFQGEEDMELAESDFGEDIIEDANAESVKDTLLSNPTTSSSSYSVPEPPGNVIKPQDIDITCSKLINQTIFTSVLPPPPPPPLPLGFPSMLPPPPPPPISPSSMESSLHSNQPTSFFNLISKSKSVRPDESCIQNELEITNTSLLEPSYDEIITNNEVKSSHQSLENGRLNKTDSTKSYLRSNLISVPVVKSPLKPVLTKNKLRKRRKKKNKCVKTLVEPEQNLLCITKPPAKSTIKIADDQNLVFKQSNSKSMFGINSETSSKISCSTYKAVQPAILCNTDLKEDSWEDSDYGTDYKQNRPNKKISSYEISSNKSKDEMATVDDEIDLSEMIILDEVGMSPEHIPKNEWSWESSSTQEEEEDETTLRIKALTSIPSKSVKKVTCTSEALAPQPQIQPETNCKLWEMKASQNSEHNLKRKLIGPRIKTKENPIRRRVVGIDTSKYKLTRTARNEQCRSVVRGRESLKVVIPTNSPPAFQTTEPPIPVVKRLVINVDKDSDSEEECEWTRKIRIQDTNTTIPPVSADCELERSIDELLMRARNSVDFNSATKQNTDFNSDQSHSVIEDRIMLKSSFNLCDTPLKLLPKEKQEEYMRLKAILERKEREQKQIKKNLSVKATEKCKPLLQHVLINESNKQNQKNKRFCQSNICVDTTQRKDVQSQSHRIVSKNNTIKVKNTEIDTLSFSVQNPSKQDSQTKTDSADYTKRGNLTRKVIFNVSNNVGLENKKTVSSHKIINDNDPKCHVVKSVDKNIKIIDDAKFENNNTNDKKQIEETSHSVPADTDYSQSSNNISDTTIDQENEESIIVNPESKKLTTISHDGKVQQNTMSKIKALHNEVDKDSGSSCLDPEPEIDYCNSTFDQPCSNNGISLQSGFLSASQEREENKECSTELFTQNELINKMELNDGVNYSNAKESVVDCDERYNEDRVSSTRTEIQNSDYANHPDLDTNHSANQNQNQNEDPCEELSIKKSELLSERFGLLDDLSEMAESLDDLDGHQGRLEQAALEISALRQALRTAEETLREQLSVAQELERRLYETHVAVSTRHANIAHLERTLHNASIEIPTTAQKLMSKKVNQVKEKIDKVKEKRSIVKSLICSPDSTKEKLKEMHTDFLKRRKEDTGYDDEVTNKSWLEDPKTSLLESLPVQHIWLKSNRNIDSETQTLMSVVQSENSVVLDLLTPFMNDQRKTQNKTSFGEQPTVSLGTSLLETGNSSCNDDPSVLTIQESFSKSGNLQCPKGQQGEEVHIESSKCSEGKFESLPSSSRHLDDNTADFPKSVTESQNIVRRENASSEIEHIEVNTTGKLETNTSVSLRCSEAKNCTSSKSGSSKSTSSKLHYKSILQFRDPSSRTDKPAGGQSILCPFELTGRCQDKECKFQHF